jgi:hypothetical protein
MNVANGNCYHPRNEHPSGTELQENLCSRLFRALRTVSTVTVSREADEVAMVVVPVRMSSTAEGRNFATEVGSRSNFGTLVFGRKRGPREADVFDRYGCSSVALVAGVRASSRGSRSLSSYKTKCSKTARSYLGSFCCQKTTFVLVCRLSAHYIRFPAYVVSPAFLFMQK